MKIEGLDTSKLPAELRKALEEIDASKLPDNVVKAIEDEARTIVETADALEKARGEIEKAKQKGDPDPKPDPLAKADPEVRAIVEGIQSELRKATDANAALTERLSKMEAAEKRRGLVQKAEKLTGLGMKTDEIVETLEKAEAAGVLDDVFKGLEAANARAEANVLLGEIGKSGAEQDPAEGTATFEIHKAVREIRKADPNVTEARAWADVMRKQPELYDRYLAENPQQTGRSH